MQEKQLLLEAKIFKGLADPSRLTILEALSDGSKSVTQLTELTGLTQSNASMHLGCLLECGLVQRRQEGRSAYYSLSDDSVHTVIDGVRAILERHAQEIYDCTRY